MSFSRLLKDIISGEWLIMPEEAMAKRVIALSLMQGKSTLPISEPIKAPAIKSRIAFLSNSEISGIEIAAEHENGGNIFRNYPQGSVAIIAFSGTMTKYDTCEAYGTETVGMVLQQAMDSNNIIGVVLSIDSGGGAVNSVAPITEILKSRTKPVVAWCDLAASAAYWVASFCDHIMANNNISSGFGSIGVVSTFYDFSGYFEKEGIKEHVVYAPESNYKNLPFENALKGDYTLLEDTVLSPLAKRFMGDVKKNREKTLKLDEPGIISGKMFPGVEAIKVGLADSSGNLQMAIKKVDQIATIKKFINQ